MTDLLFDHIVALHGDRPWGSVLDAGTGVHSSRWVRALPARRWTAVTADPMVAHSVAREAPPQGPTGAEGCVVVGDWSDASLLGGERFDVVLADYLLGAVEAFAPYFQHRLFERLARHVAGRLYVVGLEPLPDRPSTEAERVVTDIARTRDALTLLHGGRPYREFPLDWVRLHVERAGMRVVSARRFHNVFGHDWIERQCDACTWRIERIPDDALKDVMHARVEALRTRAHGVCEAEAGLRCGHDHVLAAEAPDGGRARCVEPEMT